MADIQRGVVKWFNDAKGFGFIEHTSGRDVFVHYSVIQTDGFKTLKDGEEVNYELSEGDKGLHAAKVIRVNVPAAAAEGAAAEGAAAEEAAADPAPMMVAPNLESGTVNTVVRTSADMIEIERSDSADQGARVGESAQSDTRRSFGQ